MPPRAIAAWMATRSVSVTPTPPRPTARPGGEMSGSDRRRAGALHARDEPRRTDRLQKLDRRDVQRELQRAADAHRAAELLVEVFRLVAGEIDRLVLDQRFGMGEAELEGEAVDQRLQRRAGRAHGARHVDEAVAALVEEAGRADRGEDLAALVVGDEDRDGDGIGERRGALGGERFQPRLEVRVDGQAIDRLLRRSGDRAIGGMRREHREGVARGGHRLRLRRPSHPRRNRARRSAARSSTRSRAACAAAAFRSGRRASGACGSATSSAASAGVSRRGSLPR